MKIKSPQTRSKQRRQRCARRKKIRQARKKPRKSQAR